MTSNNKKSAKKKVNKTNKEIKNKKINKTGDKQVEKSKKSPVPNADKNQFKPGQSGNPNGRPKGVSIKTTLRNFLDQETLGLDPIKREARIMTVQERVVLSLIWAAMKQDVKAINSIIDRIDGKVTQKLDHSGDMNISNIPDLSHLSINDLLTLMQQPNT